MHSDNTSENTNNTLIKLLPGFGQGIARVAISYPFDVLKIHMQKLYHPTTLSTFKYIIHTDPFKLYRGSSLAFALFSTERALQFYYLEKTTIEKQNPLFSALKLALIGTIYNLPVQYILTNIAIDNKHVLRIQYKEKVSTLINRVYKGYLAESTRSILGTSIYFGSYLKMRQLTNNDKLFTPFIGAASGICVWLVTFPLDTIRTECQSTMSKINLLQLVTNRIKNNGVQSLYRGISPVLFRTVPSSAIGMMIYEWLRKFT